MKQISLFFLPIALLLVPGVLVAKSSCPCTDKDHIIDALRSQPELPAAEKDIRAGLVVLMTHFAPHGKHHTMDVLSTRARKVAIKEIATNHLPDQMGNITLDLPGMGRVRILDTDEMLEIGYAMMGAHLDGRANDALLDTMLRTYGREKVVQFMAWILRELCGNVSCPMTDSVKHNWLIRTIITELTRYKVDQMLDEAMKH